MSAAWAAMLRDKYGIPAVAVAGHLTVGGVTVFTCSENIPMSTTDAPPVEWSGHCWIEVGGCIGDISIFRTAAKISQPSVLKNFIQRKFAKSAGMLLAPHADLDDLGMIYTPMFVLDEERITGLCRGQRELL
jgi:hypothetical protein